mgnify:CR=1 FL=1
MEEDVRQEIPSGNLGFIHFIALFALGIVVLLTAWSYFSQYNLNKDIAAVQDDIELIESELTEMQNQNLDAVVIAQQTIEDVESSFVWSEVITELISVTPLDTFYRSYSASTEGKMSLSVLTDTYNSAAQLVAILDGADMFTDVFVSSLTSGSAETGFEVVSFGITFNVQ